jgi:hypothetical protein
MGLPELFDWRGFPKRLFVCGDHDQQLSSGSFIRARLGFRWERHGRTLLTGPLDTRLVHAGLPAFLPGRVFFNGTVYCSAPIAPSE